MSWRSHSFGSLVATAWDRPAAFPWIHEYSPRALSSLPKENLVLLNKRDKETQRIRTTVKVRVDFVLRANQVTPAGEKHITLRIVRPDMVVLGSPELEMVEFGGDQIPVSSSRTINYENEDLPISIFWTNDGEIVPGEHLVELHSEGKMIGYSSFVLK